MSDFMPIDFDAYAADFDLKECNEHLEKYKEMVDILFEGKNPYEYGMCWLYKAFERRKNLLELENRVLLLTNKLTKLEKYVLETNHGYDSFS